MDSMLCCAVGPVVASCVLQLNISAVWLETCRVQRPLAVLKHAHAHLTAYVYSVGVDLDSAGWLNLLGQIAAVSAVAFLCSGLISTMASMASTVNGAEHVTFTPAQVRPSCNSQALSGLLLFS
jgi:hypothetical protein